MKLTQQSLQKLILKELRTLREAPDAEEDTEMETPSSDDYAVDEIRKELRIYDGLARDEPGIEDLLTAMRGRLIGIEYDIKDANLKKLVKTCIEAMDAVDDAMTELATGLADRANS